MCRGRARGGGGDTKRNSPAGSKTNLGDETEQEGEKVKKQ